MREPADYDGQIHPVDSDYLSGDIKDDTGSNDGTQVNRTSNADIHQMVLKFAQQQKPPG